MRGATKILLVAMIVASSVTAAIAQSYYRQVPTEQQRWYDRNAGY
jgi:hypothetical protein